MFDMKFKRLGDIDEYLKNRENRAFVCGQIIEKAKHKVQHGDSNAQTSVLPVQDDSECPEE